MTEDRLAGLTEMKQAALEAILAAGNISITYAYGILEEARRHLDLAVEKAVRQKKNQPQTDIKNLGILFARAFHKYGLYRADVFKILEISSKEEIKDLDSAWEKIRQSQEKK